MERIREQVELSVRRDLGWAGLMVGVVMLALSAHLALALKVSAVLVVLIAASLYLRAFGARGGEDAGRALIPLARTRRQKAGYQRAVDNAVNEICLHYGEKAAEAAILLWVMSLIFTFLG